MNSFPDNKKFAFTIFDDTDLCTVENIAPVYRLLTELGLKTTKSVWPLASTAEGKYGGCSLQDPEYLQFVLGLRDAGFEIAIHGMRNHHCSRELVKQGFTEFRRLIGKSPRVHANHSRNRENLYWGPARFKLLKPVYALASLFTGERRFEGHRLNSNFFWGDLCNETVDYVRNFVFKEVNLDRVNPSMPYHDSKTPLIKYWFSSSDGADRDRFYDLLSDSNQDRLEREGGICIVYTHFACGFVRNGCVDLGVEKQLRALAGRQGWFVPVSSLLDHLRTQRKAQQISGREFLAMERRWVLDKTGSLMNRALPSLKAAESGRWSIDHACTR